ncbi:MAG: cell division protein SepF [Thermoplasmata archaeon]
MIGDFFKKKTHKRSIKGERFGSEEYIDLGELMESVDFTEKADTLIKVAEVHRYEDIRNVTDELYNGNILLVDTESIAGNQDALKRVHNELKAVANDVSGDVAAVGQNYLAVTPAGIGIDRKKIKPY